MTDVDIQRRAQGRQRARRGSTRERATPCLAHRWSGVPGRPHRWWRHCSGTFERPEQHRSGQRCYDDIDSSHFGEAHRADRTGTDHARRSVLPERLHVHSRGDPVFDLVWTWCRGHQPPGDNPTQRRAAGGSLRRRPTCACTGGFRGRLSVAPAPDHLRSALKSHFGWLW